MSIGFDLRDFKSRSSIVRARVVSSGTTPHDGPWTTVSSSSQSQPTPLQMRSSALLFLGNADPLRAIGVAAGSRIAEFGSATLPLAIGGRWMRLLPPTCDGCGRRRSYPLPISLVCSALAVPWSTTWKARGVIVRSESRRPGLRGRHPEYSSRHPAPIRSGSPIENHSTDRASGTHRPHSEDVAPSLCRPPRIRRPRRETTSAKVSEEPRNHPAPSLAGCRRG